MGKKHKKKKEVSRPEKPHFIETYWDRIIIILLLLLPLVYFASFLNPGKMIAGSDYLLERYVLEKWSVEQSETPLWYPHIFSGTPVLGAPVGLQMFIFEQLRRIIPPHVVMVIKFITIFFLAGLGAYIYLKKIGVSKYSAALGAVIYQFIGNLATAPQAGQAARAASVALFPLIIFFIHNGLESKKLRYFIFAGLITACSFYEGQFQLTYYGLLFIFGYAIFYLIAYRKQNKVKDITKAISFGLLSVILICLFMAAVWLPVLGGLGTAARGVARGYEYATSWAMPAHELIDLVIPTYSGLLDNYWGFNSFKIHLEYFGMFSVILALFAIIFYWKKPYVKFYSISTLVVVLIALGSATPVFRIFYTLIPGFRLFRAPSLIFFLASFGFIVLASIAFDNIAHNKPEKQNSDRFKKKVYITGAIIIFALLIIGIICATGKDSIVRSMQQAMSPKLNTQWGAQIAQMKLSRITANYPDFVNGIWRSAVFAVIFLALVFLAFRQRTKLWILIIAGIAITLIDQLPLVSKYLPAGPAPQKFYAADEATKFIVKDKSVFRVFPTPWYEHTTDLHLLYHNIQSAGGYIPNPIQRYQEYIGAGTSVMFRPPNLLQYPQFMDMLNIKYLIGPTLPADVSQYDAQTQRAIEEIRIFFSRYKLVYNGQRYSVYLNEYMLPRAYIVYDYEVLSGLEILDRLKSPDFNPRQKAVLEYDPHISHPDTNFSFTVPQIISYDANKVVCSVESNKPGIMVLTDNWHPDWKVFVDGQENRLFRANYTFRAVPIEPGKHEVVFEYVSGYFNLGRVISIIAFVLSIAFCVVALKYKL